MSDLINTLELFIDTAQSNNNIHFCSLHVINKTSLPCTGLEDPNYIKCFLCVFSVNRNTKINLSE
jgi:hypothetical protein